MLNGDRNLYGLRVRGRDFCATSNHHRFRRLLRNADSYIAIWRVYKLARCFPSSVAKIASEVGALFYVATNHPSLRKNVGTDHIPILAPVEAPHWRKCWNTSVLICAVATVILLAYCKSRFKERQTPDCGLKTSPLNQTSSRRRWDFSFHFKALPLKENGKNIDPNTPHTHIKCVLNLVYKIVKFHQ